MPAIAHKPSKEEVLTAYRRSALLESARKVFGQCGFEGATMERIAQEAGVAKGTTYLYYSSKQSIYDEALNEGMAELEELTRVRLEHAATLREAIAAFISARVDYFLERREFFRMYVAAVAGHVSEGHSRPTEFRSLINRQTRRLEAAVAEAIGRGEIRAVDPTATALAIFDLTRGMVVRKFLAGRGVHDAAAHAKDAEFLTGLIWDGLAGRGAAKAGPVARTRTTNQKTTKRTR
jgi:AcrR family transcriptional regulator